MFRPTENMGSNLCRLRAARRRRRAFTLVEVLIVLGIFAFLMIIMTSQLIEGAALSFKTSRSLDYARNARQIIGWLAADTHSAQLMTIYPAYADRSTTASDGESGNYLVLQELDTNGAIVRTVGYYAVANEPGNTWTLYRHDSDEGVLDPETLPDSAASGTHRRFIRTLRLPEENTLFRNLRNRSFSLRGEFGTADNAPNARLEFIQCALTTRS